MDSGHTNFWKKSRGFTLFEIMIAIFIFGIIATTIFGSYSAVFSSAETIHESIGSYDMGKNCLDRMVRDLKELHVTPDSAYARGG